MDILADLYRQLASGVDIPAPKALLSRIKPEDAARVLPGVPYSLLTNLAHMHFWQDLWLNKIKGAPRPSFLEDWKEPPTSEFPSIRKAFLEGFEEAGAMANNHPSEEHALVLVSIAIHNAYHLGQIKLIKRALRASTASG